MIGWFGEDLWDAASNAAEGVADAITGGGGASVGTSAINLAAGAAAGTGGGFLDAAVTSLGVDPYAASRAVSAPISSFGKRSTSPTVVARVDSGALRSAFDLMRPAAPTRFAGTTVVGRTGMAAGGAAATVAPAGGAGLPADRVMMARPAPRSSGMSTTTIAIGAVAVLGALFVLKGR